MSKTFFIKKTAFDDTSNNIAVRESTSFVIGPGELNGPAGIARNSDLRLYGFGSAKWGEGVDQNLFRILENFACPRKESGDPGYDANNPKPKDEGDLGLGNGITVPVIGQEWFDTTSEIVHIFTLSGWSPIFDPNNLNFNGNRISNVADPVDPQDAATLNYVDSHYVSLVYGDANYVNVAGDTMTGILTMGSGSSIAMSGNRITALGDAISGGDAVSRLFADGRYVNKSAGDTITGSLVFASGANIIMTNGSITGLSTAAPLASSDAISRGAGDNRYLKLSGGTMIGSLAMSNQRITSVGTPINTTDAVNKNYADGKVPFFTYGHVSAVGYTNIVGSWSNTSNYFDVFPPANYTMADLAGFIPSIGKIYFNGDVNADDSMRVQPSYLSDRIRVYVQNTEQRATPWGNYLAVWIK